MIIQPYKDITLENFADWVKEGWSGPRQRPPKDDLAIMALGLAGETGEVIEPIKKMLRGDGPVNKDDLTLELGDVLHYLCRIAKFFDIDPGDIMRANIMKIENRRGTRKMDANA